MTTTTEYQHQTWEEAIGAFLRSLEGKNRSPLTLRAYEIDLRQFRAWLEENTYAPTPADVARADITEYLAQMGHRGITGVSRARKLAALREFFRFLEANEQLPKNPVLGVETPRRESAARSWLRPEEYRAMLAEAGAHPRDYAILQVFLQTGVRVSELCDIRFTDLDLAGRTIRVRGKGLAERVIELERKAIEAIKTCLASRPETLTDHLFVNKDGGAISERMVRKIVTKYKHRAGITKRGSCHSLRHTMATYKAQHGISAFRLKEWLGHKNIATTQIYVHLGQGNAQKEMEATSL